MKVKTKVLFKKKNKSISSILRTSFFVVILVFIVSIISCLYYINQMSAQYNRLISNATFANNLSVYAQTQINEEIWQIVVGRQNFDEGLQYQTLEQIDQDLKKLRDNTLNMENLSLLESAELATATMKDYVNILRDQIYSNSAVSENQFIMQEINNVSSLIYNVLQEYSYGETNVASEINNTIQTTTRWIGTLIIFLVLVTVIFMIVTWRSLNTAIAIPLKKFENMSTQIAQGDLTTRVDIPEIFELVPLAKCLNEMAERVDLLLKENIQKQKNLQKSEIRALQAQITPHFLYNTFDTIVWLAEEGNTEDVVDITLAFTDFYRISLSSGQDWITLESEIEHVRNYLTIQSYRYQEILDYHIFLDDTVKKDYILKLTLQPLVENALYHGIKNKRDTGTITVKACLTEDHMLMCSVSDTGIGMSQEKIEMLQENFLAEEPPEDSGYGLYNVNRRIKLYYDSGGLQINSKPGIGTTISFILPRKPLEDNQYV